MIITIQTAEAQPSARTVSRILRRLADYLEGNPIRAERSALDQLFGKIFLDGKVVAVADAEPSTTTLAERADG